MTLLDRLQTLLPEMVEALGELVRAESPSADAELTAACGRVLEAQVAGLLGGPAPQRLEGDGRRHLYWRFGGPTRVLLLGHLDTVWPAGTLHRWPFEVDGATATGPGCFDMKAGLVQGLFALAHLDELSGVSLLVTSDEEIGSPTSQRLIEVAAAGADAVLVLEPSADGALKTARKGVSHFGVSITGRAAHAGLEPELGANAGVELAHQVLAVEALGDPGAGTSVTPTVASVGTTPNTVPDAAHFHVDVRTAQPAEEQRVRSDLARLSPRLSGTRIQLNAGPNRPPLPVQASTGLFELARTVAARLGLPELRGVAVGGGSDGNFTAAAGVPTLDGLGAFGGGAHAEGEHVRLDAMPERAALVAGLVAELLRRR